MEIYRNDIATVRIDVPVTSSTQSIDVKAYDGSILLYDFPTVLRVGEGYEVTLPFSLVDRDRNFVVHWSFTYLEGATPRLFTTETPVIVTTPYVSVAEVREMLGSDSVQFTDAQLKRAERQIRGIINSYTGQSFGRAFGTRRVTGAGEGQLRLQERLISLESVTGANIWQTGATSWAIRGDGWYLGYAVPSASGDWVFTNVIRDPTDTYLGGFREDVVYEITGTWGYDQVPTDVKEAALLLIEKQLCPDSEYRDRYIDNVRYADVRYEFHSKAFNGTGSITADQLLEPYRRFAMTVI